MIQTKEKLFLAELGINPKEEIELDYGAKMKITDLLKEYETKQLTSFSEYLKERGILTTKKENIPVRVDLFLKRG